MRRGRRWGVAVLAGTVGLALLTPVQADAVDKVDTSKLRQAVTVNGILTHERALQRIANRNDGTRASGTPGFLASRNYVIGQLRDAGYAVTVQKFTFPYFADNAPAELSEVSPTAKDFETETFEYSGSGEVTGTLVPTKDVVIPPASTPSSSSGCEAGDFPTAPSGPAVALIQRGTCDFGVKAANAKAAGYEAAIIFNEGQEGRQELLTGTLGSLVDLPVVGLSYADGKALYDQTKAGTVTVRVATDTTYDPSRTTYNVIADSPQGKKKGETVVIGAHLDSVPAGPGINDNGSGTATILEIAKQMSALQLNGKLQRQVRFAFWGAEEFGLLGSEHYVDSLSDAQLTGIYANLNFDMVGSPNYARFVYDGDGSSEGVAGPPGSDAIEKIFTDYFAGARLHSSPTAFDGRSDYGPFIAVGIPAGGLFSGAEGIKTAAEAKVYGGTAGQPYDACYHQACDDINNLNAKALNELGDAAAHATAVLALSPSGLYPDRSLAPQTAKRERVATPLSAQGHALTR